ncbi:retroviral-like aspartic protease family protein [Sphingopyxis sp. BSN-002]|uniref:retropepsin-like aspartic protease family protein n=1 Tax=Sphingopyxis sp. BSN-002 TaxID=2911495 RepID=UPI001EDBD9E8|nr:retropepsin-like aspartic protease [Sphingopyxis sp. BSN-002]UKK84228.1 retroviral-like aspartic protease family protein [Sphingopyxis sp. BSN-002]
MLGRIITMCAIIAAGSIAVGSMATRDAGSSRAPAADDSNANWTTQPRTHGSAQAPATRSSSGEVRLGRSGDSHFYADTEVNGTSIRMMVDSGASIIALTRRDAEAIGIDVDRLPVAGTAKTAGGDVPMRVVMLDSVDVDGIEVRHVEAAVVDADMGVSLLGQSYLSKLDAVNVEGDTMTLR